MVLKKLHVLFIIAFIVLIYTRFVGLDWGLPYPMHPDERNMANAIQSLECPDISDIKTCLNPHFFAYGQPPLYLAYGMVKVWHVITQAAGDGISFVQATMSLRIISAIASILNVFVLWKFLQIFAKTSKNKKFSLWAILILIFSPYFIQLSHFGTTESLLMLLYSIITYCSIRFLSGIGSERKNLVYASALAGMAIAIKISAISFIAVPIMAIFIKTFLSKKKPILKVKSILGYVITTMLITVPLALVLSPHNILSYTEFANSMTYEISVGRGESIVFYTRSFDQTVPILFQITRVFPYTLGLIQFILFLIAFVNLNWKNSKFNLIRFAILIYFIPSAFLYTKWSRFMSPIFPLMSIMALVQLHQMYSQKSLFLKKYLLAVMGIIIILPGVAYVSVYQSEDVRFTASRWIYENIPSGTHILSETANVVDVPTGIPGEVVPRAAYDRSSFDFYHLDFNGQIQLDLINEIERSEYIFIPSRRIFANHTCWELEPRMWSSKNKKINNVLNGYYPNRCAYLSATYLKLNNYYNRLFLGELGYEKVAEFSSYPKISIFGKTLMQFPDENAEETWTVFDHPVIRIYKRI